MSECFDIYQGTVSLKLKSSFLCTKYTSLGANLPPKSFSGMAPRDLVIDFILGLFDGIDKFIVINQWPNGFGQILQSIISETLQYDKSYLIKKYHFYMI